MRDDSTIERRLHDLVAPIVTDLGLDLYDLDFAGGVLKVTVDTPPGSPGGVDVDALAQCTRLLSRELDHSDPIPGHYTLEVSSPGLERTLRLPRHFRREVGKTVTIRLRDVESSERRVDGVLVAADDEAATVRPEPTKADPEPADRRIPYDRIDRARTVFVWGGAAKPGGGRPGGKTGRGTADSSARKSASKSAMKSSPTSQNTNRHDQEPSQS